VRDPAVGTKPRQRKQRPSTDPGPFRSRSLAPIGWIVAAVVAGAGVLLYVVAPEERPERAPPPVAAEQPIPPPPAPPPKPKPVPDGPNDVLGRAPDLKAVYSRFRDSRDPIERALAGRALRACFPLFMPPLNQAPTVNHVLRTLPAEHRATRQPAIEVLHQRCRAFFVQPMDLADIIANTQRATNSDLATPGALARWWLMRGDRAKAEAIVTQALASAEPYALQSLAGLSALMIKPPSAANPAATDGALALLACHYGAACAADSLLALELCATEGRCSGTARERMVARLGAADAVAIEAEVERIKLLIDRNDATVGTVWRGTR
jgi:hypothetical protein